MDLILDQLIEREHVTDAVSELQCWVRTLGICERHFRKFQIAFPLNFHGEVQQLFRKVGLFAVHTAQQQHIIAHTYFTGESGHAAGIKA
jgi:hypothetical protein